MGGVKETDFGKYSMADDCQNAVGGVKTNRCSSTTNSNFFNSVCTSDFFSDCLPAAICLQRQQGCLPSKVCSRALCQELCCRFSASMVVQAMDCSASQCVPVAERVAMIIKM